MKRLLALLAALACLLAGCGTEPEPTEPTLPPPQANPYTPADFVLTDGRMACTAAEARTGVDVSSHQGEIDWAAVAADGVDFAMIRAGYRGIEAGRIDTDARAAENVAGALAAGLEVGLYFFSQAVTPEEAAREAAFLIRFAEDYPITMPLVFDWEHVENPDARTAQLRDPALLTACAETFASMVEAAGYTPMLYFNRYQSRELFDLRVLREYPFWLAFYDAPLDFPYRVAMWQYTDSGAVDGIGGKVDLNLYFPGTQP